MKISRELAIKILKYLDENKSFYFPFLVVCKEHTEEDDDFVEIEPNEWKIIFEDDKYKTFELWENLQNLDEETMELMAKGFLEKITGSSDVRFFIFYTNEGLTFQPKSEEDLPEIENCQVLGWGEGETAEDAFNNFKQENFWLDKMRFNKVIGIELRNKKEQYFNLKIN